MVERRQVTYRFPGNAEVRYVDAAPPRGAAVTRAGERHWVVTSPERDAAGREVVHCAPLAEYMRQLRHDARKMRRNAAELRARSAAVLRRAELQRARTRELKEAWGPHAS